MASHFRVLSAAGSLNPIIIDIVGQTILSLGRAILFIVACLAVSLASTHLMLVASSPYLQLTPLHTHTHSYQSWWPKMSRHWLPISPGEQHTLQLRTTGMEGWHNMTSFNRITYLCFSVEKGLQATKLPDRNGDGWKVIKFWIYFEVRTDRNFERTDMKTERGEKREKERRERGREKERGKREREREEEKERMGQGEERAESRMTSGTLSLKN